RGYGLPYLSLHAHAAGCSGPIDDFGGVADHAFVSDDGFALAVAHDDPGNAGDGKNFHQRDAEKDAPADRHVENPALAVLEREGDIQGHQAAESDEARGEYEFRADHENAAEEQEDGGAFGAGEAQQIKRQYDADYHEIPPALIKPGPS